jgi:predicted esterase
VGSPHGALITSNSEQGHQTAFMVPIRLLFKFCLNRTNCVPRFDIYRLGFDPSEMDRVEDEQGMLKTRHSLDALITSEVDAGIPANRIVLGGFSQGGAMTVLTGLSSERRLAGLAVLSGWAPMRKTLKSMLADHFKKLPIFWGHGTEDPLVTYAVGKASKEWLESVGIKKAESTGEVGLDFHAYQGLDHSTDEGELEDLKDFLVKVLPKDS